MAYKDPKKTKEYAKQYSAKHRKHLNKYCCEWRKKNLKKSKAIKKKYADKLSKKRKEIKDIKEKNKYF